jgi:hypothetical protein
MKARTLIIASVFALATPALAADDATKVDPAKSGPTEKMTDKVPDMKAPAGSTTEQHRPTKNVGESVPAMQPGDKNAATGASTGESGGESKADDKQKQ